MSAYVLKPSTPARSSHAHLWTLIAQVFGVDEAVLVALGALAAVGYVILLEKAADDIGSGRQDPLTQLQGNARFAMPVLLLSLVALRNYLSEPGVLAPLKLVSKEDFIAAIGGFVGSSRLPLLFRELRASITGEDILGMLPGSLGQGRQILSTMQGADTMTSSLMDESRPRSTPVFMVSGPRVLDRSPLVKAIMSEDDRLAAPKWCTTRPLKQAEVEAQKLVSLGQVRFEDLERKGDFLHTYQDTQGESYGLRLEDILAASEKKVRRVHHLLARYQTSPPQHGRFRCLCHLSNPTPRSESSAQRRAHDVWVGLPVAFNRFDEQVEIS